MKRPWQIWIAFTLCLAIVIPAMIWLTIKAVETDRARIEARRLADEGRVQAERQEVLSNALWRMEWLVAPLVAQEAARPYFFYEPFYTVSESKPAIKSKTPKPSTRQIPSPLLFRTSEYVFVHFQIDAKGSWSCPQEPQGEQFVAACNLGLTQKSVEDCSNRIDQLQLICKPQELLAQLPEQSIPELDFVPDEGGNLAMNFNGNQYLNGDATDANDMQIAQMTREMRGATPSQQQGVPQTWSQQRDNRPPLGQGSSFNLRNNTALEAGINKLIQQRVENRESPVPMPDGNIREGISRPIWIKDQLIIARRVNYQGRILIQGCWLDWEKIKKVLIEEVSDLVTGVDLIPVREIENTNPVLTLASLPAQIVASEAALSSINTRSQITPIGTSEFSAIHLALWVAWVGLFLAAGSIVYLMQGIIKLSERRATFVSSVTHELRTPLTTFRMYSEMLAEDMITDENQKKEYAGVLRVEADRLAHLVENVLQYARLERGNLQAKQQATPSGSLLDAIEPRLRERCEAESMKLQVDISDDARDTVVDTDRDAVEQILFNLIENACKYASGASDRRVVLTCGRQGRSVEFVVRDFGPGIPPHKRNEIFRPFRKSDQEAADTAQGVGLGLSLCRRLARQLGGSLAIRNVEPGAAFVLTLPRSNKRMG